MTRWSVLAVVLFSEAVRAESALTLEEVFSSVERTHPGLEKAQANVSKAQGKAKSTMGAFDPQMGVRGQVDPMGYYQTRRLEATVRQFTPFLGAQMFAGYRVGLGNFPSYKGDLETLSEGELRAGLELPLWKDSYIDPRRADIQRSAFQAEASQCDFTSTQLKVRQDAAKSYFKWLAAGQEVRIQRELLEVAQQRDQALVTQAKEGKIPELVVLDNQRLMLDRQAKLLESQRDLSVASLDLSLYLRTDAQVPIVVSEKRLPASAKLFIDFSLPTEEQDLDAATRQRPELCRLKKEAQAASVDVNLAYNQRAPGIHATAFAAQDVGVGKESLAPTEVGVGLRFDMPLLLTKARGDLESAEAEARSVRAVTRETQDRIGAQVRQARVDVKTAQLLLDLASKQVIAASRLAEAERIRFQEGASDLVVVNLRELAAAEAARSEVKANEALQRAHIDYLTAVGNLTLGN